MSYIPLAVILMVLVVGAAATLTILFYANQKGYFRNLRAGAYLIFDDDEPVGTPQDQLLHSDEQPDRDDPESSDAST
ncbi:MAG: hypothetical protein R6T83_09185 [Salinibacter sp.]